MQSISLSPGKLKRIARESSGNNSLQRQLSRESVCTQWLKSHRIPCWRNPSPSGYSILFSDGSRIIVCGYRDAVLSLEDAAAAGCFGAVAVQMDDDLRRGRVMGYVPLGRFAEDTVCFDLSSRGLESQADFLHHLYRPAGYLFVFFIFSVRLLLIGEPYPPERGIGEVAKFTPALTGMREE